MQPLATQRIVVAISGGIAAYKSAELVRLLVQAQAEVRVVMTQAACEFITPLTLQALSGHPVHLHRLDQDTEAGMGHIELARWAQRVVVAPATAHTLARLAHGLADQPGTGTDGDIGYDQQLLAHIKRIHNAGVTGGRGEQGSGEFGR